MEIISGSLYIHIKTFTENLLTLATEINHTVIKTSHSYIIIHEIYNTNTCMILFHITLHTKLLL